jgi:hypothetical protein
MHGRNTFHAIAPLQTHLGACCDQTAHQVCSTCKVKHLQAGNAWVPDMQAALTGQLMAAVLSRRAEKRYDAESMALSAELLRRNPEVYTVWNYRCTSLPAAHSPSDC